MLTMTHTECARCEDAARHAETMAKVTGSVGTTAINDDTLVGGTIHTATWERR